MNIINFIVKCLTFWGAVFRSFFEQNACRSKKIAVEDTKCFSRDSYCGHIFHEPAENLKQIRALCLRPFFMSLIFGLIFTLPASYYLFFMEFQLSLNPYTLISILLLWIGISLLSNMFPSPDDGLSYRRLAAESGKGFDKFMSALTGLGSALERTGVTLVTSILFAVCSAFVLSLILPLFYEMTRSMGVSSMM